MDQTQTPAIGQLLDPKQVHAAVLLSAGHPIDEVCQTLSIGRATLYRWRQEPRFAAYLNELLRTHADQSLCQSAQMLSIATNRIRTILEDPNTPLELQIRIAFKIMSLYSRPSYYRHLQSLPDTPHDVAREQFRHEAALVGVKQELHRADLEGFEMWMNDHKDAIKTAQTFDAAHPNPQRILERSQMRQSETSGAQLPMHPHPLPPIPPAPIRTHAAPSPNSRPRTNPSPSSACAKAIDAALASTRNDIAVVRT